MPWDEFDDDIDRDIEMEQAPTTSPNHCNIPSNGRSTYKSNIRWGPWPYESFALTAHPQAQAASLQSTADFWAEPVAEAIIHPHLSNYCPSCILRPWSPPSAPEVVSEMTNGVHQSSSHRPDALDPSYSS